MGIKELFPHLFKNSDSKSISLNVNSQKGDTKKKRTINKISTRGDFNNSGTINSGTTNNYYINNSILNNNKDKEKEKYNDEQVYYSYYKRINLDGMKSFLDMMLNGGIWNDCDNKRLFDFLDHVTKESDTLFFDDGLETRRVAFVNSCNNFYREIINQIGTYRGELKYSLRNDDNDYQELAKSQKIMAPLSKAMYDSYYDLVMYARKEKKFL